MMTKAESRACSNDTRRFRSASIALLAGFLSACAHTGPPDQLTLTVAGPRPEPFAVFSGGAASGLLTRHMRTMVDFSEGAARRHRVSVVSLRSASEELQRQMLSELIAAYARLPEAAYRLRWLTVSALADLERSEALETLSAIALSELPPERLSQLDPHASSQGEELAIRLATVRGVARLASRGNATADSRLLEMVESSPHRAIRLQAIQGFLYAPLHLLDRVPLSRYRQSDEYLRRLAVVRETLPAGMQELLEVQPLSSELAPTPTEVMDAIRTPVVPRGVRPAPGLFSVGPVAGPAPESGP